MKVTYIYHTTPDWLEYTGQSGVTTFCRKIYILSDFVQIEWNLIIQNKLKYAFWTLCQSNLFVVKAEKDRTEYLLKHTYRYTSALGLTTPDEMISDDRRIKLCIC